MMGFNSSMQSMDIARQRMEESARAARRPHLLSRRPRRQRARRQQT